MFCFLILCSFYISRFDISLCIEDSYICLCMWFYSSFVGEVVEEVFFRFFIEV